MEHFKTFLNRRYLLWELVKKGVKLKYRRSYLGILWSLIEPLLTTIVLTIVFGTLFGNNEVDYPVYILCGRLIYSFFSSGTNGALKSIRANSGMIKKVYVPKYLYPLSSILFNFIISLLSMVILIPLMVYCGVTPTHRLIYVLIPLLLLLLITFGMGMILSTIAVFFRDMEYLWNVALMLIMYTAAIFYKPERLLNSDYAWILKYNPVFSVVDLFRSCIMGKPINLFYAEYALGFGVVTLLIGTFVFYKKQNDFILHI